MALVTAPTHDLGEAEELSDDQIQALLARASARMKSKQTSTEITTFDKPQKYTFPKLDTGTLEKSYVSKQGNVAVLDGCRLVDPQQRQLANGFRKVEDPTVTQKVADEMKKATAGPSWYNLPKTKMTPELKRDLQLLKMRGVLDPHRHYKKDGGKMKAPEYSQMGTIVEGPTEFFTGRIENKKRKRTFVEEVLAGEQETGRFKKKYGELQGKKTSGKKTFYKELKAKRKAGGKKSGHG